MDFSGGESYPGLLQTSARLRLDVKHFLPGRKKRTSSEVSVAPRGSAGQMSTKVRSALRSSSGTSLSMANVGLALGGNHGESLWRSRGTIGEIAGNRRGIAGRHVVELSSADRRAARSATEERGSRPAAPRLSSRRRKKSTTADVIAAASAAAAPTAELYGSSAGLSPWENRPYRTTPSGNGRYSKINVLARAAVDLAATARPCRRGRQTTATLMVCYAWLQEAGCRRVVSPSPPPRPVGLEPNDQVWLKYRITLALNCLPICDH